MRSVIFLMIVSCSLGCSCPEQFAAGALLSTGGVSASFEGSNGSIHTATGMRRESNGGVGPHEALFHVMMLLPEADFIGGGGSYSQDGCLGSTKTFRWVLAPDADAKRVSDVPGNTQEFTVTFDGGAKVVRLGEIEYQLESGNLFVVRFNEAWHVATEQINVDTRVLLPVAQLDSVSFEATLQAFKQASPDDRVIQELKLE
jgi:hypothetical protein